jgi:predicted dehydrogenase
MVGFVLRYSPFYSKVKELVSSGIIGRVLTINATEPIGSPLVILFNRSWRREEEIAGPFILEKCCHDLDVIRMIADSNAETVVSFGKRSHFNHHNQPASHCSVCSIEKSCIYSSRNNSARINQYSQNAPNDDYEGMLEKIGAIQGEQDICVYNDFEHPDHQTVSIVFENGVLANFLYIWGQYNQSPEDHKHVGTGRTIQVCGSSGQIFGNFDDNELTVIHWEDGKGPRRDVISIKTDGSGHGGSEASLTDTFIRMIRGEECEIKATVEDGVEAARLSLAADLSRKTGRIVTMKDLD